MLHSERLPKILSETFRSSIKTVDIAKLAGDASNRVYSRLRWQQNGTRRSAILMERLDSESAKTSDEAGSKTTNGIQELPFINIQKHLSACKIPVPEIYFFNETRGWILLEDMGETSLAEALGNPPYDLSRTRAYYRKAIDALVSIQLEATAQQNQPTIAHLRRFDRSLFEWEFDHFIEYGIEAQNEIPIDAKKKMALRSFFSEISAGLAALPQVFTHRDYHSRNLMIDGTPARFEMFSCTSLTAQWSGANSSRKIAVPTPIGIANAAVPTVIQMVPNSAALMPDSSA